VSSCPNLSLSPNKSPDLGSAPAGPQTAVYGIMTLLTRRHGHSLDATRWFRARSASLYEAHACTSPLCGLDQPVLARSARIWALYGPLMSGRSLFVTGHGRGPACDTNATWPKHRLKRFDGHLARSVQNASGAREAISIISVTIRIHISACVLHSRTVRFVQQHLPAVQSSSAQTQQNAAKPRHSASSTPTIDI
jgi:hypothetical protein